MLFTGKDSVHLTIGRSLLQSFNSVSTARCQVIVINPDLRIHAANLRSAQVNLHDTLKGLLVAQAINIPTKIEIRDMEAITGTGVGVPILAKKCRCDPGVKAMLSLRDLQILEMPAQSA